MEKLKACPHCGGHAEIKDWTCGYESGTSVYCIQCGASVNAGVENGNGWHDRAIAAWNRRTAPENKPLTLEQLQQMDGNPAYVKNIVHPDCTGWKVCGGSFDGYFYFSNGETYELSHYGQTWIAYARKPEGSKKS